MEGDSFKCFYGKIEFPLCTYSWWNVKWITLYLCCLLTEMAEIWSPGTFFQDVWTCKISALYLLYFQNYGHLVEITKYTTETFITLKVQEIES